jgi:phosphatidylserine synthase|tara:strand:+ start:888 stop:1415 length:528 start_codon:yes stop_codon:yes gene_type:complete
MSDTNETQLERHAISGETRGGVWVPVVLATIGVGVLLSGIFTGAIGLYGDVPQITFGIGIQESARVATRLVLFALLLLAALRIHCWRVRRPLGNVLLAALRCLAVISLIEAIRVVQIDPIYVRIPLITLAQLIIAVATILGLFVLTLRETILFVVWCSVGTALLWGGAQIGTWIA